MKGIKIALQAFPVMATLLISVAGNAATVSTSFTINEVFSVPCAAGGAGEDVAVSGQLHAVAGLTLNGNNVHFVAVFNPQDVIGVGLTTGDKYQGAGVTRENLNLSLSSGIPGEFTYVNAFHLIGQASASNLSIHETIHVTVNANGTFTVTIDKLSVICQ